MTVIAHGIDLVEVDELAKIFEKWGHLSLSFYFTENELAEVGNTSNRFERLAARFAIKEAVLKALGTGWGNGIAFTDVEVISSNIGKPEIILHRKLLTIANEKGIKFWHVSTSHIKTLAVASVIGTT